MPDRSRRGIQVAAIAAALLLLFASYPTSHVDASSEKWTFMVYSCADCDLEGYQLGYISQMASIGSTAYVNMVVQMDRIPGYSTSYGDWTDCKRFYVSQGMTPTRENAIASLGEVNMGDRNTLAGFLVWAIQDYPADRYFVMIIGHGWIDGVCPDWTSEDILTPLEIRWALSQAKNITGVKADIIGIEACQQAALEIAYEIGDYADIIIASEEVSTHWPYAFILSDLASAEGTMTPSSVASMVVDYYSQYSQVTGGNIMALSALNLSSVNTDVAPATDALADRLIANITRYAHAITEAATQAESHEPIYSAEEAASCRDLYDFALKLKRRIPDAPVQLAAQNLISAIQQARVAEWHGPGHPNFHGLYIYLPDNEEVFNARTSIYGQLYPTAHPLWTQDTNWDELLSLLFRTYAQGLRSQEQITNSSFTPFDSDSDDYLDALHVTLDLQTSGDPIDVVACGFLIDPYGGVVDQSNCSRTVSGAGGLCDIYLHVPDGGTEGLYSAKVIVYDEYGVFEDGVSSQHAVFFPEEMRHAVSAQSISFAKTVVGQGYQTKIEVTVGNDGHYQEFLNVTTYANETLVDVTQLVIPNGVNVTFSVYWNTAEYEMGNYTVTVLVDPIDGETNITDNLVSGDREVCVSLPGDVDADHDVDIFDIVQLTSAYGMVEGRTEYDSNRDINGDRNIDIFDVVICTSHYGQKYS